MFWENEDIDQCATFFTEKYAESKQRLRNKMISVICGNHFNIIRFDLICRASINMVWLDLS